MMIVSKLWNMNLMNEVLSIPHVQGESVMSEKPKIDLEALETLEKSKNEILERVAAKLRQQVEAPQCGAGHSSHSSGASSRTHSSTTTGH